MTWLAMWMLASFQSTSVPFIQILPVPGKPITTPYETILPDWVIRRSGITRSLNPQSLLFFAAERAAIGAGVQGLAAVPAEARRLRRFARLQPRLDVFAAFGVGPAAADDGRPGRPPDDGAGAGGQHFFEQFAGALIAVVDVGRHRFQDDVV